MTQGGYVTLTGYVVSEPKLRFVNGGTPVVNLRVGSTSRKIDRATGEWRNGETSYFTVACWRTLASNVASCLRKGEPIVVRGRFRSSTYEDKEGRSHVFVDIEADTVGHDLCKGVAHFQRTRYPAAGTAELAAGEAIRSGAAAEGVPSPGDGEAVTQAGSSSAESHDGGAPGGESSGGAREAAGAPETADAQEADDVCEAGDAGEGGDTREDGDMFDEQAVTELERELEEAAPEPAPL
ncbi:MAG TPA: single-stranded DNA-binding protein [Streptosporangiaceae bacterium]|nr:single-stranded DNA-binding protein [Streptosporangiaceae bacterium]